jgi:hypothetical protein
MTYPDGATERIRINPTSLAIVSSGGVKTTKRTRRMIIAARLLFQLRGGGTPPKIVQGGYNPGGVGASGGTHDEDALDFGTKYFSLTRSKLWEWCVWMVGFASWRRIYIAGLWSAHTHSLPKLGQLSPAADRQIVQWYQGDDALRSDRDYPRILSSGLVARTFEKWLDVSHGGDIYLTETRRAFKTSTRIPASSRAFNDVAQIQSRLNLYTGSSLAVDGYPGPATIGVYETYQARLYSVSKSHPDADGIPGFDSLTRLGFTVIP